MNPKNVILVAKMNFGYNSIPGYNLYDAFKPIGSRDGNGEFYGVYVRKGI